MREPMDSGWRKRRPQRFPVHYPIVIRRRHEGVATGLLSDLSLQDAWGSASEPLLVGEGCVLRLALRPDEAYVLLPAFIRTVQGLNFRAQLACPNARTTYELVQWFREQRRAQDSDEGLALAAPVGLALEDEGLVLAAPVGLSA
jgi:hypothetical protein